MADVRETIDAPLQPRTLRRRAGRGGGRARRRRRAALRAVADSHRDAGSCSRASSGLSEGTLRDRMTERFGETPPLARAADVAPVLEELYRERGYLRATVRVGAADRRARSGSRDAGLRRRPRARARSSRTRPITGRPLEPPAQIEERLRIKPGQPYEPGALATRLADYLTWMRHRRYYEAVGVGAAAAIHRRPNPGRRHRRRPAGTARHRRVHRRPAAQGQDRRAGADRARRIGRSGSARRLGGPDQGLPEPAGLLEGRGHDARAARKPTGGSRWSSTSSAAQLYHVAPGGDRDQRQQGGVGRRLSARS